MTSPTLKRPALGSNVTLGALYDARNDSFLHQSLARGPLPQSALNSAVVNKIETASCNNDTFKEKFTNLEIGPELSASFLAGLVAPDKSGRYLLQKRGAFPTIHRAFYHTLNTKQETLNLASSDAREALDLDTLSSTSATHIVTGVTWGAQTVVTATRQVSSDENRLEIEKALEEAFKKFEEEDSSDYAKPARYKALMSVNDSFEIIVHSDMLSNDEDPPAGIDSAHGLITSIPLRVQTFTDEGKGVPLCYTLLPISFLALLGIAVPNEAPVRQLEPDIQQKFVDLMDDSRTTLQNLNDYYHSLKIHRSYVNADHVIEVLDKLNEAKEAESYLKSSYGRVIRAVRSGKVEAGEPQQLLQNLLNGPCAPAKLHAMMSEYSNKLKFILPMVEGGAKYVGYRGQSLNDFLRRNAQGTSYVLYFSNDAMKMKESWAANVKAFSRILLNAGPTSLDIVVDCDATGDDLEKPRISKFNGTNMIAQDVLEQQKYLSDKSLLRYDDAYLDDTINHVPASRKGVKIPCPGQDCSSQQVYEWICFKCHVPVEYGTVDRFLYCDCGRTPYDKVAFKCQGQGHGPHFARYRDTHLRRALESLPDPRELNILILGETGVGKSTFINAFVNYLTFSSLDEGMSADKLNWIIPCSFATQSVDEQTGRLLQHRVKIGADADEADGLSGDSATQKATVYPLYIGGTLVRLIDTPGIGDVRGIEQDRKNMVNVLSVLRNYDQLHGILILLKPNNSRLNVLFRFCVKELLTHLHRNAAQNMIFGFTNTRGSNYQPGDTFNPLEKLLDEYKDVIKGLYRDNVYCFDSESFRYLAARKKGIDIGNLDDYRRSWDHSAKEATRLLEYTHNLIPHQVKSTLSLNETRYLISQLTKPMQQISKAIADSIAQNEKQTDDLKNTRATGKALHSKLNIHKTVVDAKQLDKPKTVCAHKSCVTVKDRSGPNGETIKLRKSLCHNPCCLTNVPPYKVGTRELIHCAAFSNEKCTRCHHHWSEHEHIRVEFTEKSQTETDPTVAAAITVNGNETQAKEAQLIVLAKHIAELKGEHQQIQEAAAQFRVYLKKNSITRGINDATLEYFEHLIKEERSKVSLGGSRARLEALEKDKDRYEHYVKLLEEGKQVGAIRQALDEDGVYRLVETLYRMPHYGQQLKRVAQVVGMAYAASYRERPYRVRGRNYWQSSGPDRHSRSLSFNPAPARGHGYSSSYSTRPVSNQLLGEKAVSRPASQQVTSMLDPYAPPPRRNGYPDEKRGLQGQSQAGSAYSNGYSTGELEYPNEPAAAPPPYEVEASIGGANGRKISKGGWMKSLGKSAVNKLSKKEKK